MVDEFDKLVRDETPKIIEENGEKPIIRSAEGDEYFERLAEKLDEGVTEYLESGEPCGSTNDSTKPSAVDWIEHISDPSLFIFILLIQKNTKCLPFTEK